MKKVSGRMLRSENVELCGRFVIGSGGGDVTSPAGIDTSADAAAQAHVVERHPEYAVIEITCSCGSKMYLRCDYAASMAGQGAEVAAPAAS